jgi:hypothetical protein
MTNPTLNDKILAVLDIMAPVLKKLATQMDELETKLNDIQDALTANEQASHDRFEALKAKTRKKK